MTEMAHKRNVLIAKFTSDSSEDASDDKSGQRSQTTSMRQAQK